MQRTALRNAPNVFPIAEPPGPNALVAMPIADPPIAQRYVIPGSQYLDPPYSWQLKPDWPFPRSPLAYESETRAPGTGMIHGGGSS